MRRTARRPIVAAGDETAFGLRQVDDLKRDAMLGRCCRSTFAGIALINPGHFDGVVGDGLHGTREALHLAAAFSAGRRDMERQ